MRRTLVVAALAVSALAPILPVGPVSACDPNRPPWCQNACSIAGDTYNGVRNTVGRGPYWHNLDLGACGT